MIYKSIEIEFCQRNSWANKFMVDYGKNWTVACQSGKSWGINQRQANASQPDRWHTADMMAIWLGPLENGNWNHSEPIIGHLSGISESLAEFLNWKMQIFAGRCWLLFLESQTEKAEKNWIDGPKTKSKSGQQPWNWILRFIAKQSAAVACQMCRSGMPQESVWDRNQNQKMGELRGRWLAAWLTFCRSRWDFEFVLLLLCFVTGVRFL